jgi:cytochrome oxidase Cu insertion factor (SCO1/SenC/PrrC family)
VDRRASASPTPALVLGLWLATTLSWWAFAFAPLPAHAPGWVAAARSACFGTAASGLPGAAGWMLLALAPATFLLALVALWGAELGRSLRAVARSRAGRAAVAAAVVAAAVEGTWVAAKVDAARAVERWNAPAPGGPAALPAAYPRASGPAPDFALVDQHGRTVALAALRGRPVIVTFVFAHCETMCPAVVETLKRATAGAAPPAVLLVTLDPWRDTPNALPGLVRLWRLPGHFHVLSARRVDDVLAVTRAWGVPFERDARTGDIAHPGLVFVVDPAGRLGYTFNNPPAGWVRDALDRLG